MTIAVLLRSGMMRKYHVPFCRAVEGVTLSLTLIRINHDKLLSKCQTFPKFRRQLKAWLKSGILDNGKTFKPGDKIETDHIVPRKAGGNKLKDNLQVLHKHCHDVKTKADLLTITAVCR